MSVCYDHKTKHYYIDAKILLKNGRYKHVSYRENFNDNFKNKKYVASIEYRIIEELKAKANREFTIDSLENLYDRYYKSIENEKSINTMIQKDTLFNNYLKPNFTSLNSFFDVSELERFRILLSKKDLSSNYRNSIIALARDLIDYARKIKVIDSDTKDDCLYAIEKVHLKVESKKEQVNKYTPIEDFKKIIEVCDDKNLKDIITLLYFSGLRIGEFLGIKVSDITFSNDMAIVEIQRQVLNTGTITTRLKTSSSYKKIAYVNGNAKILNEYIERNNLQSGDFLTLDNRGVIRRKLNRLFKKAGVEINTLHGFGRKSINTELYLHGADSKIRKTLLGQTSEDVNETNYTDNETAFNKGVEILKSLN